MAPGKCYPNEGNGPGDSKNNAEREYLKTYVAERRIHKLGQEGQDKDDHFRIEQVGEKASTKRFCQPGTPAASRTLTERPRSTGGPTTWTQRTAYPSSPAGYCGAFSRNST